MADAQDFNDFARERSDEELRRAAENARRYEPPPPPPADEPAHSAESRGKTAGAARFSEEALALRFAEQHADDLRYVAAWSRWLRWDGTRWAFDDTLAAFDQVRFVCREAAQEASKLKNGQRIAPTLASAKTVAAVERLAKADRRLAATVGQWDQDADLLNTPAGMVDLRSGRLLPHDRTKHSTKVTLVAPAPPGAPCPIWDRFLHRVTDGDPELVAFLQRVAGYALTGSTCEHALFFAYGTGRNGKGVYLNTLTAIAGDYAAVAGMETFTASNSPQHPTDLAMLRGARLVAAQETEEGRRWAEAKIKALTGGDPVTARFMRQDFFTFQPQFKLLIAGNHKPGLRGVDEAIRARFHLIPFTVTIPAGERDPDLPEKLKAEWPAILRWAIDGTLAWRERGLDPPAVVRAATDEYLSEQDSFCAWLDERCERAERWFESTADLFASWKIWAEKAGEYVGSRKQFGDALRSRSFTDKRQPGTGQRGFEGIRLRRPDYTDDPRAGG